MHILVLDVAASESGALSILNQFYNEVNELESGKNKWFFLISTPNLTDTNYIKVIKYPWIKKSWLHRIYFDKIHLKKIIKEYDIDCIFSLQNVIVDNCKLPQLLYLHQPLPFTNIKFKFFENPRFWIYQNVISKKIIKSVKNADKVIVQTTWMKEAILKKGCKDKNIVILPPNLNKCFNQTCFDKYDNTKFIYPATPLFYKNHQLIIDACIKLKNKGIENYKVYFTFNKDINNISKKLYSQTKSNQLNIEFLNTLSMEELIAKYQECTLIFPSFIETFGLPLLEARYNSSIVLASDTSFSREILENYENSFFYDYSDASKLAVLMQKVIQNEICKKKILCTIKKNPTIFETVLNILNMEGIWRK